jgi:hypothetical protein
MTRPLGRVSFVWAEVSARAGRNLGPGVTHFGTLSFLFLFRTWPPLFFLSNLEFSVSSRKCGNNGSKLAKAKNGG